MRVLPERYARVAVTRETNASAAVTLYSDALYFRQILEFLAAAAFANAVQCVNLTDGSKDKCECRREASENCVW